MNQCLYVFRPFTYEKGNKGCSCHGILRFQIGEHLEIVGEPFYVDHIGWYVGVVKQGEEPFPMSADFIDELYAKDALRTSVDLSLELNYHTYKIDEALENKEEQLFMKHSAAYQKIKSVLSEPALVKEG